ncbi:MAG: phospholipase D-like domain-containing protein, partial [Vicinamibacterales bacterium]
MTIEDVVKRFEFARPELRLVGYEEVGLPFYRVKVRAFTLEHKPIAAIDEFVLKCVHAGLVTPVDISALLGLPHAVVEGSLSNLVRSEDVQLGVQADGRTHVWKLTLRGETTLRDAEQITAQQGTFEVDYDGLLRRVVNYKREPNFAPRELKETGLLEIPAHPVRPPEITDLRHEDVAREIAADTGRAKRQLVSIVTLEKRIRYFLPAVALVYRSEGDARVEVAFAINGRLSAEHETAFAKADGPKRLGMDLPPPPATPENLGFGKEPAASQIAAALPLPARQRELSRAVADAESELVSAREVVNAATTAEQPQAIAQMKESETKLDRARQAVDILGVTYLQVFDHPPRLEEAMREARERLLIVSPWIGAVVVSDDFIRKLAKLSDRGVRIFIGYGIGDDQNRPRSPRDEQAEKKLNDAARMFKNLQVKRFGDTHAKVLAYDRKWAILTSFNWLSFKGSK